jgi:hypothetical protein
MSRTYYTSVMFIAAIVAIGFFWTAGAAQATVNVYFTPTSDDWNAAGNWIDTAGLSRVPTNNDNPTIGSGYASYYYPNRACTYSLTGGNAATLTVGDSSSGTLTITGGSLTVVNSFRAGYIRAGVPGTGTVYQQGGTVKVNGSSGGLAGFGLGYGLGDFGTYNMSGGSLSTPRLWVGRGSDSSADGGSGVFNLTGGTVSVTGYAALSYSFSSALPNNGTAGTMTIDGGTFNDSAPLYVGYAGTASSICLFKSGSASVTGATYVGGYNSGSIAAGVIEQTGGIFTATGGLNVGRYGPGTYTIAGGTLSVPGAVAIGNSTGTGKFEVQGLLDTITWGGASATLGANSTLSYVAGTTGVSDIVLSNTSTGALTINGAALLSLNFAAMTSATHDLLLVDNYGTDLIVGTFSNYAENAVAATFGDGSYFTLTYVYDAATTLGAGHNVAAPNDLALIAHAAPEPSTMALLGMGLVGLLAYAWRKEK